MKKWEADVRGHKILIVNTMTSEALFVNGELQDERIGLKTESRLFGKLPTGEEIKVSIGGNFKIVCRLFVDNKLVNTY